MTSSDEDDALVQAMRQLDDGLDRIAKTHARAVVLLEEDPETFGAGHYVLYPARNAHARFAIEEQYARGVDWSDPDRIPTSWLWRAEHIARQADGRHAWQNEAFGEIESEKVARLLETAEQWALRIRRETAPAPAAHRPARRGPSPSAPTR
ncbi:hypothetical protein [Microbacterium lacticum]